MKTGDVYKAQQFTKVTWEAVQGWLWLSLMWLSILVNFNHIQDILARWAGTSDWTTYMGALIVEAISGLSFSNALTNLGTILASTGKSATKERKRRAMLYFALSLLAGLGAVGFSAWVNVLWFNGVIAAGVVAPMATMVCAIMEASRRYEIRVQADVKAEASKCQVERKARQEARKLLSSLGKAEATFVKLCQDPCQSQASIAQSLSISRQAVSNHIAKLEQVGAIKRDGNGGYEVLWRLP